MRSCGCGCGRRGWCWWRRGTRSGLTTGRIWVRWGGSSRWDVGGVFGAGDDLGVYSRLGIRWENLSPLRDDRMDNHGEVCVALCLAFLFFVKEMTLALCLAFLPCSSWRKWHCHLAWLSCLVLRKGNDTGILLGLLACLLALPTWRKWRRWMRLAPPRLWLWNFPRVKQVGMRKKKKRKKNPPLLVAALAEMMEMEMEMDGWILWLRFDVSEQSEWGRRKEEGGRRKEEGWLYLDSY